MEDATEGERIYAVGDIHGRRDLLEAMLARIGADRAARPHPSPRLVFVGDYVDRGPDSRGVLDTLVRLRNSPIATTFLLGNHDNYFIEYAADPAWDERAHHWFHPAIGGMATLRSYGVEVDRPESPGLYRDAFLAAMPVEHLEFLNECELVRRIGGYVFVHAGIRPGVRLEAQSRDDLIWIRDPFLNSTEDFGFKVVHGHTIVDHVQHLPNRISIDTGVARGGPLSCVVLEGAQAALLTDSGPDALPLGSGVGFDRLSRDMRRRFDAIWGGE